MSEALGKQIQFLRERAGMTQAALAKLTGLTRVTISNAENGRSTPNRTSMAILAKAFGVTPEYLRGDEMSIGTRVQLLRTAKGMTQEDLADKAGLTRPTLSYLENSKYHPQPSTLIAVADALEVTVEDLKSGGEIASGVRVPEVYIHVDISVICERCGLVRVVGSWAEAEQIRDRHAIPHPPAETLDTEVK